MYISCLPGPEVWFWFILLLDSLAVVELDGKLNLFPILEFLSGSAGLTRGVGRFMVVAEVGDLKLSLDFINDGEEGVDLEPNRDLIDVSLAVFSAAKEDMLFLFMMVLPPKRDFTLQDFVSATMVISKSNE